MKTTEQLIDQMASGLEPVKPVRPGGPWMLWLCLSASLVVLLIHSAGPLRPTAAQQLLSVPRFVLEMALGVASAIALALVAFRAGTPGLLQRHMLFVSGALCCLWLANFVLGFAFPVLEPGMLGKRDHCVVETVIYGLPPLLGLLYWQRRMYPLSPGGASALAGCAAGILPALYMQVACMYEPGHILAFHVAPILLLGLGSPLLLWAWNRLSPSPRV